ncbi:hypothetical protein B0T10DRAFT_589930 [Thelonectria olida]|uniref:NADPH--cytochrome P450 reductase n=1 Tax=Thelonectria olida TaxID=1576542 RepID=A0A9P8WBA1_9HYPO|nr:hypothetical protein B0T10DRAFT_589930 [Thelonectria olida]
MANTFATHAASQLSQLGPPQSTADVVALAAVGVASAAYMLNGIAWNRPDPYDHIWYQRMEPRGSGGGAKATRNIAQKLEESGKNVVIFWGSQSGTAETFAGRLAKECHLRFNLQTLCADLCDYDPETIALIPQTKLAIFIVSTYGEGDPSDNTQGLWEWIHKKPFDIKLPNLRYMAFGLGNTSYRYYNRVIDVVTEALDKAGAQSLMPVGKANDANGGTEEDFLAWKDGLYEVFLSQLGFKEQDIPYTPSIRLVEDESLDIIDLHLGEPKESRSGPAKLVKAYSPIRPLNVQSSHELYTSPIRNCLHMELDIADHPELRYTTGDHLAVYPINPDHEVQLLLRALGLEERAEKPLLIQSLEKGEAVKIPSPTTLSALFRHYLEVCAPVSREIVGQLAKFAPSQDAANLLSSLGKDKNGYAAFIAKNHVTFGRLLALVAPGAVWKDLPLSYVAETLPSLQPRYYSISSSSVVSARKIAITVGVDNTPSAANASIEVRGVTTNYLNSLSNNLNGVANHAVDLPSYALSGPGGSLGGDKVYACIRRSQFKLPSLSATPLIMIGAGTGMAPFRGFVLERARLKAIGKPVGHMILFFGCRRPDEDYLYSQELAEAAASLDDLLQIVPAFSRADGVPKVYVQDRVGEMKRHVCELLDAKASLYVCGRASMAREVGKVVESAMKEQNNWSDADARSWAESAKKSNKWLEDVWG